MTKRKRTYPDTFKEQAISLLRGSGRSAADIERELGITPGLLSRWHRKQAQREGTVLTRRTPPSVTEQPLDERVKQLERENARLRQEKEILKHIIGFRCNRLAQTPDSKWEQCASLAFKWWLMPGLLLSKVERGLLIMFLKRG